MATWLSRTRDVSSANLPVEASFSDSGVDVPELIQLCNRSFHAWKDRPAQQGTLARCLGHTSGVLVEIKQRLAGKGRACPAALLRELDRAVRHGCERANRYDQRPWLLADSCHLVLEQVKCNMLREQLQLLLHMLVAACVPGFVDRLVSAMHPLLVGLENDARMYVHSRIQALQDAKPPLAPAAVLRRHMQEATQHTLAGEGEEGARLSVLSVNDMVASQAPEAVKQHLQALNSLGKTASTAQPDVEHDVYPAATVTQASVLDALTRFSRGDSEARRILAFSCPVEHMIYTVAGDALPVAMQPCGCTVSRRAACTVAAGRPVCPCCGAVLSMPAFKPDVCTMRVLLAASDVEVVDPKLVSVSELKLGWGGEAVVVQGQYRGEQVAVKRMQVDLSVVLNVRSIWNVVALTQAAADVSDTVCKPLCVAWRRGEAWLVQELCSDRLTNTVADAADLRVCPAGGLPAADVALLVLELSAACLAMHGSTGAVHRDISPQNVLLRGRQVSLIDFGIAGQAATARSLAQHGAAQPGKLNYAPPEQRQPTAPLHLAMDVYAIGATALFAATNSPPYGRSEYVVLDAHRSGQSMKVPAELPGGLRVLLASMVQLSRCKRPSMQQVYEGALALYREYVQSATALFLTPSQDFGVQAPAADLVIRGGPQGCQQNGSSAGPNEALGTSNVLSKARLAHRNAASSTKPAPPGDGPQASPQPSGADSRQLHRWRMGEAPLGVVELIKAGYAAEACWRNSCLVLQATLARCLYCTAQALHEMQACITSQSSSTSVRILHELDRVVQQGLDRLERFNRFPWLLADDFHSVPEEVKCTLIHEELQLLLQMLVAASLPSCYEGAVSALQAAMRPALQPAANAPTTLRDLAEQRIEALRAALQPHTSTADIHHHLAVFQDSVLLGLPDFTDRQHLKSMNFAVASQIRDPVGQLLVELNELRMGYETRAEELAVEHLAPSSSTFAEEGLFSVLLRARDGDLKARRVLALTCGDMQQRRSFHVQREDLGAAAGVVLALTGPAAPFHESLDTCRYRIVPKAAVVATGQGRAGAVDRQEAGAAGTTQTLSPRRSVSVSVMRMLLAASEVELVDPRLVTLHKDVVLQSTAGYTGEELDQPAAGRRGSPWTVVRGTYAGQPVAVKRVQVDYSRVRNIRAAWRELIVPLQLGGMLSGSICKLLCVACLPSEVLLVQQWCDERLVDVVARAGEDAAAADGGLPAVDVALLVLELAAACVRMHRYDRVHSAINPHNVLLKQRTVCLINYADPYRLDQTALAYFTASAFHDRPRARYQPPDHGAFNTFIDCDVDVYGIAATAVFAATNAAPPHSGEGDGGCRPPPPVPPGLPADLRGLLTAMLRLDPCERPGMGRIYQQALSAYRSQLATAGASAYLASSRDYGTKGPPGRGSA